MKSGNLNFLELSGLLQACNGTALARKLATKEADFQIVEEASNETLSGTLKPDLVVVNEERVHVIDVTVRHEDMGYLDEGHNSQNGKYMPLLPILAVLAEQLNMEPDRVLLVAVGTRGSIPNSTLSSLKDLNITDRGSFTTLALLTLRNSVEMQGYSK